MPEPDAPPRPLVSLDPDSGETLDRLLTQDRIAVDTESDPFHRFFERVCLIQLSTLDEDFIYDPLEHGGLPASLRPVFDGGVPTLVLHGAESDVRVIKQSFEFTLGPLFDTQLAARFLGKEKTGLKDLLELELGVEIDKGEQRSDWGKRPLSASQLAYARQDTQHLLPLAETLEAQLRTLGRLEWHYEECQLARAFEPTVKVFDPESWRKIKGARELGGRGRKVLAAAVAWRDEAARLKDVPAFRIVRSDGLLRAAREIDRHGEKALPRLMNSGPWPKSTDHVGLEDTIRRALDAPDPGRHRPRDSKAKGSPRPPHVKKSLDRLREERTKWATKLGIDPGFLMPVSLMERVARDAPRDIAQLRDIAGITEWRVEALGHEILGSLAVIETEKGC